MPLVTLTVCKPKSTEFKHQVLDAVHAALVAAGVPATDQFHRVLELESENFRFDIHYPDLQRPRNQDFVLIEILFSVGRNIKIKKKILADLIARLEQHQFDPENIMVSFQETAWENWSFGGGRFLHT